MAKPDEFFGVAGRLRSVAEPAGRGGVWRHLNDPSIYEKRFVNLHGEAGRILRRGGSASRTHGNSWPKPLDPDASVFMFFAGWCVGGDDHPGGVSGQLNGLRIFSGENGVCGRQAMAGDQGATRDDFPADRFPRDELRAGFGSTGGEDFGMEGRAELEAEEFVGWESSGHKDAAYEKRKPFATSSKLGRLHSLKFKTAKLLFISYGDIRK